MDATFLQKIKNSYPELKFISGKQFSFRPPHTIVIGPEETNDVSLLLHELGHALSGHRTFSTGAGRLKMEVEAWSKAREIAPDLGVEISDDAMEAELDTYRDWLHKKSRCPKCGLTRFQTPDGAYHCPRCENF